MQVIVRGVSDIFRTKEYDVEYDSKADRYFIKVRFYDNLVKEDKYYEITEKKAQSLQKIYEVDVEGYYEECFKVLKDLK